MLAQLIVVEKSNQRRFYVRCNIEKFGNGGYVVECSGRIGAIIPEKNEKYP